MADIDLEAAKERIRKAARGERSETTVKLWFDILPKDVQEKLRKDDEIRDLLPKLFEAKPKARRRSPKIKLEPGEFSSFIGKHADDIVQSYDALVEKIKERGRGYKYRKPTWSEFMEEMANRGVPKDVLSRMQKSFGNQERYTGRKLKFMFQKSAEISDAILEVAYKHEAKDFRVERMSLRELSRHPRIKTDITTLKRNLRKMKEVPVVKKFIQHHKYRV
ncbi:MAG: hypothetical protein J7L23_00805 [Candidatus Diapherotrites archaeon]|nr:hypothetical protein [Candidatus Diapherotrites archaeon]